MKNRLVVFTGGGTAGHVFPAFPVADRLKERGCELLWLGSAGGAERAWVEGRGMAFKGIPSGKLRRYFSLKNLTDLFRVLAGLIVSFAVLVRRRPALVFSKGGFVSVPPVAAARLLGIAVFTHESDVDPGLATRLNLRLGAVALLSYGETRAFLPAAAAGRARVTGNPVRDVFFHGDAVRGRALAGMAAAGVAGVAAEGMPAEGAPAANAVPEQGRPLVLVLGGSQGAREINDYITENLDDILQMAVVVHQRGEGNSGLPDRPGYMSRPFFTDELPHLMAAADVAVSRCGAGSLWELAATGTPALFVPLRGASRGDQLRNAAVGERLGMSLTLGEDEGSGEFMEKLRLLVLNADVRRKMAEAASGLHAAGAAENIAAVLGEVLDGGD